MITRPRSRLWGGVALALAALALLAAATTWYFSPPRYEAFALLKVSSTQPAVLAAGRVDPQEFPIFKRTQAQLLLSGVVLNGVLRNPEIKQLPTVRRHRNNEVAWLKSQLTIDYPNDAEILRIAIDGNREEDLVKIVNKVTDVYLKEIVEREKQTRRDDETKLEKAYERQTAEYQKQLDALKALEAIHQTSGSEEARLTKDLAREELETWLAQRRKLLDRLEETELELRLQRPGEPRPEESRTAVVEAPESQPGEAGPEAAHSVSPETDAAEVAPAAPAVLNPVDRLTITHDFLEEKQADARRMILESVEQLASLESFSAGVAAKQEEVAALRQINDQLRAKLNCLRVDRLAPDRITRVEDAQASPDAGRPRWLAAAVGLSGLGLGLVAAGAFGLRRPRGSTYPIA